MFYYTYILKSLKNNSLYIGYTSDLRKRFERHNKGLNKATKPFIPYKLIHYEAFLNRVDAKRREVYLKSGWGFKSIQKMLERYFQRKIRLNSLYQKRFNPFVDFRNKDSICSKLQTYILWPQLHL